MTCHSENMFLENLDDTKSTVVLNLVAIQLNWLPSRPIVLNVQSIFGCTSIVFKSSINALNDLSLETCYCCRKTVVCNGDQLLDFSVPELVRSQSTFSTDPEVASELHRFHIVQVSGSSSWRMFCRFDTMHVVCTDSLCVACIGLLSAEFSTVNTALRRAMFWKTLCLLSTPEDVATTNYQLT